MNENQQENWFFIDIITMNGNYPHSLINSRILKFHLRAQKLTNKRKFCAKRNIKNSINFLLGTGIFSIFAILFLSQMLLLKEGRKQ